MSDILENSYYEGLLESFVYIMNSYIMNISLFFLNSKRFLLKLRTLIVAILPGLIFGNYLLYDSLNFMEQIEATS